jgi:hypothetical protein
VSETVKLYRIEAESRSTFTRVVVPVQAENEMQAMKFAREYINKEYSDYGKKWRIQIFEEKQVTPPPDHGAEKG